MKGFAKMTKLGDVGGRADYISNPDKQEEIVAMSEPVDWAPYQEYERTHQRSAEKNIEGRELVISIPNEWYNLPKQELKARAQTIAEVAVGKSTDMQWAIHWNKGRTNLHIHVIFSEREKIENPKRWDRDIYLTEDGKVARKKADRAKNEDGSIKPPVHKKGDLKDGFSIKNPEYHSRGWLNDKKQELKSFMEKEYGVVFKEPSLLHEYHHGKGKEAPAIKRKNELVRATNEYYDMVREVYQPTAKENKILKQKAMKALKNDEVLFIAYDNGLNITFLTLEEHYKVMQALGKDKEAVPMQSDPAPAVFKTPSEIKIEQIKAVMKEKSDVRAEIDDLRSQQKALGFFQRKEKKEMEEKITDKYRELQAFDKKYEALGIGRNSSPEREIELLERNIPAERHALEMRTKQTTMKEVDAKNKEREKTAGRGDLDRVNVKTKSSHQDWGE